MSDDRPRVSEPPAPAVRARKAALKQSAATEPVKRSLRPAGGQEPATGVRAAARPIDPLGPVTPGLDRRTSKKLSRGELPPEARIDLHGMSAERAQAELIGFIRTQYATGARCVLVITGKGGRGDQSLNGWRSERVGVLRTMAPEWLRQPPLGGLVTAVYQAHRRHGGDGALYVYLRKNR